MTEAFSKSRETKSKVKDFLYTPVPMTATEWLVDCVIALGVFGFGIIQLALTANLFVPDPFTRMILGINSVGIYPIEIVATMLLSVIVVFRRRLPWPCFIFTLALWVIFDMGFQITSLSMVPVLVSLFTLAYERGATQTLVASAISLFAIVLTQFSPGSTSLSSLLLFQNSCMVVAVAFAGYALNARAGRLAALEAQAAEMEHAKEAEALRRVEEERVRIARELHDITAHSLSAIGIQAAVAERMIGINDEEASSAVCQIRTISKEALADMRAMVGVLRGNAGAETTPVMGTSSLQDLVEYLHGFDIDCKLDIKGYDKGVVASHIDVALFKIAREAVTNIARHSGAKHASIHLEMAHSENDGLGDTSAQGQVRLVISDDGKGITGEQLSVGGHGLSGMRERAQVLGGSMKVINNASEFDSAQFDVHDFDGVGTSLDIRIPIDAK